MLLTLRKVRLVDDSLADSLVADGEVTTTQSFQAFLFHSASGGLGIGDPAGQEGWGSDVCHRRKRRKSQVPHG